MENYLESKNIIVWGADVEPGESHLNSTEELVTKTLDALKRKDAKGIIVLHSDPNTATAMPDLMRRLKEEAYCFVQVELPD